MASLVDLERLQQDQQAARPAPQQLKTYFSPSLTPQGPPRPLNEPIMSGNNRNANMVPGISTSGNFDMRPGGSGHSDQRRLASRTDVFANSFIQGRKVDSPKIFRGHQVSDERPKTTAQPARKGKTKGGSDNLGKESKKKTSHQRKNATTLHASQVVATASSQLQGRPLLNLGLHTNKEVDSRKFDFGLPPHAQKASSNQASATQSKKKKSIARAQNTKMHRHQRNYTTQQDHQNRLQTQVNNFMSDEGSAAAGSTLEFEPVNPGGTSVIMTKSQAKQMSKSSKTVKEQKDGYSKVRSSHQQQANTQVPSNAQSTSNSNYQQHRKRQLSQNMPKTLLNVSQSTGAKPSVSLNTSQVMSAKHSTGFHKPKTSMNLPQTTKNLVVKPPIGNNSSLIQKKKSTLAQPSEYSNTLSGGKAGGADGPVSRSHRSGAAHFNSGTTNHTRNKSAERTTSTGLNSAKNKGLTALKVGKSSAGNPKTDRGQGNLTAQNKTSSGNTSRGLKNLSSHLLDNSNPISVAIKKGDSVRASLPLMGEKENMQGTSNQAHQRHNRTMRQVNLSGDDGDFSISSMSGDSASHRNNKSTLNKTNSGHGGKDPLKNIFGKNYFVDGEQLLRHISPSQPVRSPRDLSQDPTNQINLLNVTDMKDGLRLTKQQFSGKRSKTTRAQRPQTSKQLHTGRQAHNQGDGDLIRTTLDSDTNLNTRMVLSGKTNKSQLDGLQLAPQYALSHQTNDRRDRSNERERSKSKGKGAKEAANSMAQHAVSGDKGSGAAERATTRKQKMSSVDKLIKKNIRQKGKQTAEEMLKKFMEENQKKKRQKDLIQMNQEIKKQNAVKHLERDIGHSVIKPFDGDNKKHRSKSCIQNRDNFFHGAHSGIVSPNLKQYQVQGSSRDKRDKSYEAGTLNKTSILYSGGAPIEKKRHPARDKNCVIELSLLKKEVDDEIRRDRKKNLIQIRNPKVNMSAIVKSSSQKERSQVRTALNQRAEGASKPGSNSMQTALNYTSLRRKDPELVLEQQNLTDGNIKAKVKRVIQTGNIEYNGGTPSGLNTSKIQKFIEKQKKRNAAKTKLQQTIEHEKILRVHENLTKLHNFTVNNRLRQSGVKDVPKPTPQPPSTTQARRSAEKQIFAEFKQPRRQRDSRSGKQRYADSFSNQQKYGTTRYDFGDSESAHKVRASRFNSSDSRRRSSGYRYQEPGETLHHDDEEINVYERNTHGSSPQTRKLSSKSRHSNSNATSPHDRIHLSGSAAAPLRVLKPKLSSAGKHKASQQHRESSHESRMRSIEAEKALIDSANYNLPHHGLFQSLDAEKARVEQQQKDPMDASKQFESIEPNRVNQVYERSHENTRSPPGRRILKNLINKYGLRGESDAVNIKRLNSAAAKIQRLMYFDQQNKVEVEEEYIEEEEEEQSMSEAPQQRSLQIATENVDASNSDLMQPGSTQNKEQSSMSDLRSREATGQSQRVKQSVPKLSLHKVQSHDSHTKPSGVPEQNLNLPNNTKGQSPFNQAYSNRSQRGGDPEMSTGRSIFQRDTFRQFMGPGKFRPEDLNPEDYPKMLKVREEAIQYYEKSQQKSIKREYDQKIISPRTFKRKNLELDQWVTKEKEECKRTKKKFEREGQKMAKLLHYTQQNCEQIRRILHGENSQPLVSTSSRIHYRGSSQNVESQHTDELQARDQQSKESKKSTSVRPSILDDFAVDKELILDSADSADSHGRRKVKSFRFGPPNEDPFRQKKTVNQLKEAAAVASSGGSNGESSNKQVESEAQISDDQDAMLDQISVQEPGSRVDPKNQLIRDLRSLKINEKSVDVGSQQTATPKDQQLQPVSSHEEGQFSKITSPLDNNASYIDKSMTRQFADLNISPNTGGGSGGGASAAYGDDQYDSRKTSNDSKRLLDLKSHSSKPLNTRKLDTNSSYQQSVDSAPEPPSQREVESAGSESHGKGTTSKSGLARVTSYNKLERNIIEDDSSAQSSARVVESKKPTYLQGPDADYMKQNHDLKPDVNVIQIDQTHLNLAKKLIDGDSLQSPQPQANALSHEELNDSVKREDFFLNKLTNSVSTSHDDLHATSEQNVLSKRLVEGPSMPNTTPLSTDSGAIKIEISGQPEDQDARQVSKDNMYQTQQQNLQSPLSQDSANFGIKMGSMSLSSSTSKDGHSHILPHLGSGPQDSSLVTSHGPDATFGMREQGIETTANSVNALEESKDEHPKSNESKLLSSPQSPQTIEQISKSPEKESQQILTPSQALQIQPQEKHQDSTERLAQFPGANLPPQLQAEGEALTNELLQYILQDLSNEGLDHLLNRQARRTQEARAAMRAQCTGIKTDLFAIERYVDEVHQRIAADSEGFFRVLYKPLTRDALQILNQLQNSEIGSCEHFDENYPQVLPLKLYLTLEKKRKAKREEDLREQREKEANERGITVEELQRSAPSQNFDAECEHIHNKVLFDCINDSLLQFKPFGKEGNPLPWSRSNRRLKPTDDFSLSEIFEIVKHDLFRWAINLAGTLPRREFIYQGEFDEELFSEIREKKLVQLLAREMIETEPKWLNYEFEQAQVKIDIGDMILEQLVKETITILNQNTQRDFREELE